MSELLLLFDIDGTLVDSGGAGPGALQAGLFDAFQLHGQEAAMPKLDLAGATDAAVARLLFAAFEIEDTPENRLHFFESYAGHLETMLTTGSPRLLGGAGELVTHLVAESTHALGLLTGNIELGARLKLRPWGLDQHFAFGAFGDDREHRDELGPVALERAAHHTGRPFTGAETVIIGDTPKDIACAKAFGARCIAVATGRFGEEELAPHKPDAILPHLEDLDVVLQTLR